MDNKERKKALSKIVCLTVGQIYASDIVYVFNDVLQNEIHCRNNKGIVSEKYIGYLLNTTYTSNNITMVSPC